MKLFTSTLAISALLSAAYATTDGFFRFCNAGTYDSPTDTWSCPGVNGSGLSTTDPKTNTKTCIDVLNIQWDQCVQIPDYNAKGDSMSCGSATMTAGEELKDCTFYEDSDCKSSHKASLYGNPWYISEMSYLGLPETTLFRAVKCHKYTPGSDLALFFEISRISKVR